MKQSLGSFLSGLMAKNTFSQAFVAREIGISRQQLNYIMHDQRDVTLPVALKLESLFALQEGAILRVQNDFKIQQYKNEVKQQLFDKLMQANAFWSYDNVSIEQLSDELLIEKVFVHLDMDDIAKLFILYHKAYVRKVWQENMAISGDYLFDLNVMIALYYFNIKKPEKFLRQQEQKHLKKLLNNA